MNGTGSGAGAPRTMSSNVVSRISSSPWLMLPFENKNNTTVFKFYSLAQNKVVNFSSTSKRLSQGHIELVSSSLGWLTLFNWSNCDLFLFNPLSGRLITLPPIHTLPIPDERLNLASSIRLTNVILRVFNQVLSKVARVHRGVTDNKEIRTQNQVACLLSSSQQFAKRKSPFGDPDGCHTYGMLHLHWHVHPSIFPKLWTYGSDPTKDFDSSGDSYDHGSCGEVGTGINV
ncbi:hypothetical protein BUALT_Bualt08G0002900 [Buddleja alternifolia]|uniref:KIB1-4 beta-propeller domain-containing protein n=1 Tax=Buddleja alternifolia TaxID=168488 RepID=A0AAV6X6R4_9LAMI|nr:hypothetical protein BUALT_Bualt08G0002900 [Buddleja alternifolia]